MSDINNYVRVDGPNDPERCQGRTAHGPCPYKYIKGSTFCMRHGGAHAIKREEKEAKRMYLLDKYQGRVGALSGHPDIKSLASEVGIVRMSLEEILNFCNGERNKLIVHVPQINMLANTIKGLVESLQRLQERNKLLLDKTQIFVIADAIVKLITQHVTDASVHAKLSMEIADVIERAILAEDSAGSAT